MQFIWPPYFWRAHDSCLIAIFQLSLLIFAIKWAWPSKHAARLHRASLFPFKTHNPCWEEHVLPLKLTLKWNTINTHLPFSTIACNAALQYMMNAKLSLQSYWPYHKKGFIKRIAMIIHNKVDMIRLGGLAAGCVWYGGFLWHHRW